MSKYPKWLGVSVIAFVLVVAVAVIDAQQPKKIPLIRYLSPVDRTSEFARFEAMRLGSVRHASAFTRASAKFGTNVNPKSCRSGFTRSGASGSFASNWG